jgi:hypothetical protein
LMRFPEGIHRFYRNSAISRLLSNRKPVRSRPVTAFHVSKHPC